MFEPLRLYPHNCAQIYLSQTCLCLYRHVCAQTRLCTLTFVSTHIRALTRLCPDTFVSIDVCAHICLCPHMFVPRHVCGLTCLCQDTIIVAIHDCAHMILFTYCTIVPMHDCAHSTVPKQDCRHIQLSRDTNVPRHNNIVPLTIIILIINFVPTIVPRREIALTMRVISRKLDMQFSYCY